MNNNIQRLKERRRRAVLFYRLQHGLIGFVHSPRKIVPLLIVAAAFGYLLHIRDGFIPDGLSPVLATVYSYTAMAVIVTLGAFLLVGVFYALSIPHCSRQYENALLSIDFTTHDGATPALLSRKRISGSKVSVLTFYSMGIGKELWERRKGEVEDALNVHCVQGIQYGGRKGDNRNLIVLTVGDGPGNRRTEPLYDEL